MVMEEGVATSLDPEINMWDAAAPFITEWVRSELGPEARAADWIIDNIRALSRLPDLVRRIDHYYPPPGAAPPGPPLPDLVVVRPRRWGGYLLTALLGASAGAAVMLWAG
jgi:ubiquinone biosynthesis protein